MTEQMLYAGEDLFGPEPKRGLFRKMREGLVRTLNEHWLAVYLTLAVGGIVGATQYRIKNENNSLRLNESAAIKADVNRDGMTTHDEWAMVYRNLGVHYDVKNPKQLIDIQLEHYLKMKE